MLATQLRDRARGAPPNMMREEHRSEPRRNCGARAATLFVRGLASPARVLNISTHGTMIETRAQASLDEPVVIAFEGCSPLHASVRWMNSGRIGLHFGRELVLG